MPGLSGAASFGQLACLKLESRLGAYPADFSGHWSPPDYWDADDVALEMSDHPNIWTDGSREDFSSVGGFEIAGVGVYLLASDVALENAVWGVAEVYGDARLDRCRAFMSVPGPLQFSVLNSGVPFSPCRPVGLATWPQCCRDSR